MAEDNGNRLQRPERPRYFNGQFLTEKEFNTEQDYHRRSLQLHNRMFRPGVVAIDGNDESLQVIPIGQHDVRIQYGVALDHLGRHLVCPEDIYLDLKTAPGPWPDQTVVIAISYQEEDTTRADYGTKTEMTRRIEAPLIEVIPKSGGVKAHALVLAEITLDDQGHIQNWTDQRQFARLYITSAGGWMRLPFLPRSFAGGSAERADFILFGSYAQSPAEGADGCIEIPVPPGVTRIQQLRIGGNSAASIIMTLECVGADGSVNSYLDGEEISSLEVSRDFTVNKSLNDDDALVLIVQATGESRLYFVAVEFD